MSKTKSKSARSVARGFTQALRDRGVTIDRRGRARDARGHFVSVTSLERRVARLRKTERAPERPAKPAKPAKAGKLEPSIFARGPSAVKGPAYQAEKRRLRGILGYEPTEAQMQRAMEAIRPRKKPLTYDEVIDKLRDRGVLDHEMLQRVSQHFGVKLHDVYGAFFGYPPSVGSRAA